MTTRSSSQRYVASYAMNRERVQLGLAIGDHWRPVVGVGLVDVVRDRAAGDVDPERILAAVLSAQRYAAEFYGFRGFVHEVMLYPAHYPAINGYTDCALQIFRRHACGDVGTATARWAEVAGEYRIPAAGDCGAEA